MCINTGQAFVCQAPQAMYNLALLEHDHGDTDQAWNWYAAAIGSASRYQTLKAMIGLGGLGFELGHGDSGHNYISSRAGQAATARPRSQPVRRIHQGGSGVSWCPCWIGPPVISNITPCSQRTDNE